MTEKALFHEYERTEASDLNSISSLLQTYIELVNKVILGIPGVDLTVSGLDVQPTAVPGNSVKVTAGYLIQNSSVSYPGALLTLSADQTIALAVGPGDLYYGIDIQYTEADDSSLTSKTFINTADWTTYANSVPIKTVSSFSFTTPSASYPSVPSITAGHARIALVKVPTSGIVTASEIKNKRESNTDTEIVSRLGDTQFEADQQSIDDLASYPSNYPTKVPRSIAETLGAIQLYLKKINGDEPGYSADSVKQRWFRDPPIALNALEKVPGLYQKQGLDLVCIPNSASTASTKIIVTRGNAQFVTGPSSPASSLSFVRLASDKILDITQPTISTDIVDALASEYDRVIFNKAVTSYPSITNEHGTFTSSTYAVPLSVYGVFAVINNSGTISLFAKRFPRQMTGVNISGTTLSSITDSDFSEYNRVRVSRKLQTPTGFVSGSENYSLGSPAVSTGFSVADGTYSSHTASTDVFYRLGPSLGPITGTTTFTSSFSGGTALGSDIDGGLVATGVMNPGLGSYRYRYLGSFITDASGYIVRFVRDGNRVGFSTPITFMVKSNLITSTSFYTDVTSIVSPISKSADISIIVPDNTFILPSSTRDVQVDVWAQTGTYAGYPVYNWQRQFITVLNGSSTQTILGGISFSRYALDSGAIQLSLSGNGQGAICVLIGGYYENIFDEWEVQS